LVKRLSFNLWVNVDLFKQIGWRFEIGFAWHSVWLVDRLLGARYWTCVSKQRKSCLFAEELLASPLY